MLCVDSILVSGHSGQKKTNDRRESDGMNECERFVDCAESFWK